MVLFMTEKPLTSPSNVKGSLNGIDLIRTEISIQFIAAHCFYNNKKKEDVDEVEWWFREMGIKLVLIYFEFF